MTSQAASFCETFGSRVMRENRYRMLPGWRSSDFFWRGHGRVTVSTTSIRSSAMVRGRFSRFSSVIVGVRCVVGDDDRGLAAIGVQKASRGEVKAANDGLV